MGWEVGRVWEELGGGKQNSEYVVYLFSVKISNKVIMALRLLYVVMTFVAVLSYRSHGHCAHFLVWISIDNLVIALWS